MSIQIDEVAAHALVGRTLKGKWKVLSKVEPKQGGTGGFFSVCYIVSDGNQKAFLKAINFVAFFNMHKANNRGVSIVDIMHELTEAYKYEKELLLRCKNKKLTKVSTILDEGEEFVSDFTIGNVPYLIFEMADGDIRAKINFNNNLDTAWKLRSLHHVAVGLKQLHYIEISHQDLKPSNVLIYEKGILSKIGDLGRSLCGDLEAPHENGDNFVGDFTYAPPEYLYGHFENDRLKRLRSTDMYLMGSLIIFYFTGTNMTSLIGKNLDPNFRWGSWGGTFEEVGEYLVDAFYAALKEFKTSIPNTELADELLSLINICCFPYPQKRGHPKSIAEGFNQYDLQRVISKLDILAKKAEFFKFN
ncbi:MAG: protein kinase [Chitinophaga sp.]|uniref:protein kinase domain-containing protein n=1 Tax=Chitinophaga sp. TaxID=1869181 RepID=UPI001B1BD5C6|nr:protein kinase [Chitinophaga sp.]MBO9732401.1 protein kinase [Chitinophaga sp.]